VAVSVETTPVPGLLVLRLDVRRDERGWFEEVWQREKLAALGVPDLGPVQGNIAYNALRGTTRGLHAEPWDKLVSLATGSAYAAWLDLREGPSYGATFGIALEPGTSVLVPRGVANGYQTTADATAFFYLVNDHWRPEQAYVAVNHADPALGIEWPVPLSDRVLSDRDREAPAFAEVTAVPVRRPLVLGAEGQVGRALLAAFPGARAVGRRELDLTDVAAVEAWPWRDHDVVLNAAAYTAVDDAETPEGRRAAWATNAEGPALLARMALRHELTLVHLSSDYVYDGSRPEHDEAEPPAPLGVYGQAKAAGDAAVAVAPRHYLLRASWLVGDGANFVRTMARLADEGASPSVVCDQVGRLTFASEAARAVRHLLDTGAPYGTYHVSNAGPPTSWCDIARAVFRLRGRDPQDVLAVTTGEYAADRPSAPRPSSSVLSLAKLQSTGFQPADAAEMLRDYLATLPPALP
jgi:dTDP-4-dehydrorhamnose 3,5-epimerase